MTADNAQDLVGMLPLIVDLDGTLLKTDILHEGFAALVMGRPGAALVTVWTILAHGIAAGKSAIAKYDLVDVDTLPVRTDFLAWLTKQAKAGRPLHLVSAADESITQRIAERFNIFTSFAGSNGRINLKGRNKAAYLAEQFPQGYAYAGDSSADIAVWQRAKSAVLVGTSSRVAARVEAMGIPVEAHFTDTPPSLRTLIKQFRLHQWSKNLLVFIPLMLAHRFHDLSGWINVLLAFLGLSITATATYILNDLADLNNDRTHPTKRNRPLAAGTFPVLSAFAVVPFLLALGVALAALTGIYSVIVLGAYVALTLSYSLWFKRVALLDTFFIGLLFTLRIVMGCAAVAMEPSPWMLAFALMLFFSLALAKRQTEITKRSFDSDDIAIRGRGYHVRDGLLTLGYGVSSGMASLVILMLYITNGVAYGLYRHPAWLWGVPLLLYVWQMRIWLLASRGELHDDPIVFALKDTISLVLGAGCGLAFYQAL